MHITFEIYKWSCIIQLKSDSYYSIQYSVLWSPFRRLKRKIIQPILIFSSLEKEILTTSVLFYQLIDLLRNLCDLDICLKEVVFWHN